MHDDQPDPTPSPRDSAWFQTTHWSVVTSACNPDDPLAQEALERLCRTYWHPLFVFVRRQGHSAVDAEDLVQGFFAKFIEKNYVAGIDPEKGRFRSFLLLMFKRYAANEWDHGQRERRGGGRSIISWDQQDTEQRYLVEPVDDLSPERAYDRHWALTVLDQVLKRLGGEFRSSGKQGIFEQFKVFLSGEKGSTYAEVGARLGLSEGAVKVGVHRFRQRYRELLRAEIANTVNNPKNVDDELRDLLTALG